MTYERYQRIHNDWWGMACSNWGPGPQRENGTRRCVRCGGEYTTHVIQEFLQMFLDEGMLNPPADISASAVPQDSSSGDAGTVITWTVSS